MVTLIPQLLEWLQDINWPIAEEIAKLLLEVPKETIPHIKDVLKTNDNIWKEWCLRYLVSKFPQHLIIEFEPELIRIAYNPTKGEELEEVNETAKMILELIDKKK
ncbi:DUF5071 domain-containing protein [Paenibacillus caui]|uniref:DUF5071 domain-containing protein n=1 Tax=Paenibacillus caui TaxID=2873927 RepID=UPI001F44B03C|nr:DUF5071 domain-containing protein [Paenibacillus caui]